MLPSLEHGALAIRLYYKLSDGPWQWKKNQTYPIEHIIYESGSASWGFLLRENGSLVHSGSVEDPDDVDDASDKPEGVQVQV